MPLEVLSGRAGAMPSMSLARGVVGPLGGPWRRAIGGDRARETVFTCSRSCCYLCVLVSLRRLSRRWSSANETSACSAARAPPVGTAAVAQRRLPHGSWLREATAAVLWEADSSVAAVVGSRPGRGCSQRRSPHSELRDRAEQLFGTERHCTVWGDLPWRYGFVCM